MNTYQKWMDFSTRLINIMDVTDERREKIMNEVAGFIEMYDDDDGISQWKSIADHFDECFDEYRTVSADGEFGGKFYNQISCITRAGIDVATEQLGGVIGYTVGDIRKAYDGYIPDRVCKTMDIRGDEGDDVGIWL